MCGIAGFSWKDEKLLKVMTDTLSHRGPDQYGYFVDSHVSLGHRRLSIIDLSEKGRQPMHTKNNELAIVFNGEIYNFQDLRKELESEFSFTSSSDTEVILYAYKKWGVDCFKKFNGMWAMCLYDKQAHKLVLSRDRLGKKPLYYSWDGEHIIFGSELKALLAHNIPKKINKEAMDFYLTIGYIPSPHSIYENVFKVEPRQVIEIDLKGKKLKKSFYYDFPKYDPIFDKEKLINDGRALLKDSTRLRMIADVPVGAFLSGGLDSSSVVATMTELTDKSKLHTFSIGFEGKYDETKYMEVVKDAFGTNHHHQYFTEKEFEALFDHIYHYYDEPFGDFSNFPTYEVSKLARKYVTVSLSGDGGDEIFGGYPFHQVAARLELIKILPKWLRKLAFVVWPKRKDMSFVGQIHEGLRLSFVPEQKFFAEIGSEVLYRSETFKKWSQSKMKEMLEICRGNFVEAAIKYDLFYQTLADNYLVKTDRASMANSLEIRSPFLDVRFVEYSAKIPTKWKVSAFKTKILMRDIIKGLVPEVIRTRGKQGFTPPLIEWVKQEKYQTMIKNALESLHEKKVISDDWYDFYKSKVMVSDNKVFDQCKIRILLLWKWWEAWH